MTPVCILPHGFGSCLGSLKSYIIWRSFPSRFLLSASHRQPSVRWFETSRQFCASGSPPPFAAFPSSASRLLCVPHPFGFCHTQCARVLLNIIAAYFIFSSSNLCWNVIMSKITFLVEVVGFEPHVPNREQIYSLPHLTALPNLLIMSVYPDFSFWFW